jgi:hypothetical protein
VQHDRLVEHKLYAVLAQYDLEAIVRERHSTQVALLPVDQNVGRGIRSRDAEHASVPVYPNELADLWKPLGSHARDNTRAARCIQHPVTGVQFDMIEYLGGERAAKGLGGVALKELRSIALQLILIVCHRFLARVAVDMTNYHWPCADCRSLL